MRLGRSNTASTAPSTFGAGAERVLELGSDECELRPAVQRVSKCARIAANSRGAAPWNEKIDCFSSPTAKIVRWPVARAGAGEELADQRA